MSFVDKNPVDVCYMLCSLIVYPEVVFDPPISVRVPCVKSLQCQVERAYPNFYLTMKVSGDVRQKILSGQMVNHAYTGVFERDVTFPESRTVHMMQVECVVVWMKKDKNETITVTRSVALHCKFLYRDVSI